MHKMISDESACNTEYNQVHLSWQGTTNLSSSASTYIRALFYVNESTKWPGVGWHAAALDAAAWAYHKVRTVVSDNPRSPYFQLPIVQIRPDDCGLALKAAMLRRLRVHQPFHNTTVHSSPSFAEAEALMAHERANIFRTAAHTSLLHQLGSEIRMVSVRAPAAM